MIFLSRSQFNIGIKRGVWYKITEINQKQIQFSLPNSSLIILFHRHLKICLYPIHSKIGRFRRMVDDITDRMNDLKTFHEFSVRSDDQLNKNK